MAQLRFHGPLRYRIASVLTLNRIALRVALRHALGCRMAPDWDAQQEIGIRFWRHQFTRAMAFRDMEKGRALFNSLQTFTDDVYDVREEPAPARNGTWFTPAHCTSDAVLLYFHGGGYAFRGPISARFAAMLAHHTGARLFMPQYRLTPEHPHPAQAEDALQAWQEITAQHPPEKTILIGDSAGGHMALMLLQALKRRGAAQPALCIGLCPWTDIGARGDSMTTNNRYDLVQGWMALRFGEWLDPAGSYGREALSPIFQDYAGCAPIYLQAGGREMLRDMIVDFAEIQTRLGARVTLDLWEDMPHDFQAYDSLKSSSTEALARVRDHVEQIG